jgi:hypothetical protein
METTRARCLHKTDGQGACAGNASSTRLPPPGFVRCLAGFSDNDGHPDNNINGNRWVVLVATDPGETIS